MQLLAVDLQYVESDEMFGYVYFLLERGGGPGKIKIGYTFKCPYLRLDSGRHRYAKLPGARYRKYELIGSIPIVEKRVEDALHERFAALHEPKHLDENEWFRPGVALLKFIHEHARLHVCEIGCPNGTGIQEVWEAQQRATDDVIEKALRSVLRRETSSDSEE